MKDFQVSKKDFEENWKHLLAEAAQAMRDGGTSLAIVIAHPGKDKNYLAGNVDDFHKLIGLLECVKHAALAIIMDGAETESQADLLERVKATHDHD